MAKQKYEVDFRWKNRRIAGVWLCFTWCEMSRFRNVFNLIVPFIVVNMEVHLAWISKIIFFSYIFTRISSNFLFYLEIISKYSVRMYTIFDTSSTSPPVDSTWHCVCFIHSMAKVIPHWNLYLWEKLCNCCALCESISKRFIDWILNAFGLNVTQCVIRCYWAYFFPIGPTKRVVWMLWQFYHCHRWCQMANRSPMLCVRSLVRSFVCSSCSFHLQKIWWLEI